MNLVSTELREPFAPRICHIIRRLHSEIRDDLALVEIEPSLPAHVYTTTEDLRYVILTTRFQGSSLFPMSELPLAVYICVLKNNVIPEKDMINSEDLIILDWGEVSK